MSSDMSPPQPVTSLPPPWKPSKALISLVPKSATEALLVHKLRATKLALLEARQSAVISHATMALQGAYVLRVKGQLAAEERKKQKSTVKKAQLLGDGCCRVLTSDAFDQEVEVKEVVQEAEEVAKNSRKDARAAYKQVLVIWELGELACKANNILQLSAFDVELLAWQSEQDEAKKQKRRTRWNKPTRAILDKQARRPLLKQSAADVENGAEDFLPALEAIGEGTDEEEDKEQD